MVSIVAGTGGTIKSTTLEGAIHEACNFIINLQNNTSLNPGGLKNFVGSHNQSRGTYTCSFSFPISADSNDQNQIVFTAQETFINTNFVTGTGGTFTATGIMNFFLLAIMQAQAFEKILAKNPDNLNNITGRIDTDTNEFIGTVDLSIASASDNNGNVTYTAIPYLID